MKKIDKELTNNVKYTLHLGASFSASTWIVNGETRQVSIYSGGSLKFRFRNIADACEFGKALVELTDEVEKDYNKLVDGEEIQ